MQTADLVDVALLAALHGPKLIVGEAGLGVVGIEEYWSASKCRFDRWASALARLRHGEPPSTGEQRTSVRGLFEEILGGEVLTRVWTAVVAAFDGRRDSQDNDVVARSVYIGHQEMRHRVLKLLGGSPGLTSVEAVELNRLRRRAEQWTDMLLAFLSGYEHAGEFAFEAGRVRGYADDLARVPAEAGDEPAALMQSTLRTIVRHALVSPAPNPDLNARAAAAILSGFSPEVFDDVGLFRSLWLMRLTKTADDAEQMMTDLFRSEPTTGTLPSFSRRFP